MTYKKAPALICKLVKQIAEKNHKRLDGTKIAVVMKDKATVKAGRVTFGKATKPTKRLKPLLNDDYAFVIILAEDAWARLSIGQKRALVDHELCHCFFNEKGKASLRPHDFEEFWEILKRHGFWLEDEGHKMVQAVFKTKGVKVGTLKK